MSRGSQAAACTASTWTRALELARCARDIAEEIVRECAEIGTPRVWLHRSFGQGSVSEAAVDYGREFGEIIDRTQARMRELVAGMPDGEYTFEDVMDDDGLGQVGSGRHPGHA